MKETLELGFVALVDGQVDTNASNDLNVCDCYSTIPGNPN